MAQTTLPQTRWQEIEKIWKDNRWLYVVAGILIGIISVPAIEQITGDLNTLIGNLVPETIGIIFTVLILNRAADNRAKEELKHQLLEDLKSTSVSPAVNALDRLRREGWLDDDYFVGKDLQSANWEGAHIGKLNFKGANLAKVNFQKVTCFDSRQAHQVNFTKANFRQANLQKANLQYVNFEGASFQSANLQYAQLTNANLRETDLWGAQLEGVDLRFAYLNQANLKSARLRGACLSGAWLEGADLSNAHLENTDLTKANFEGANLQLAHLEHANLDGAQLQGTDLRWAYLEGANLPSTNLQGADLRGTRLQRAEFQKRESNVGFTNRFKPRVILPDGTVWTPNVDMQRFTNPLHPKFKSTLEKINFFRQNQGYEPLIQQY